MVHILNWALCNILENTVEQRGSLCNANKFRFDFRHNKLVSLQELQEIEEFCQKCICLKVPVTTDIISFQKAKEVNAYSLMGEVYPESVRMVSMSDKHRELCKGT